MLLAAADEAAASGQLGSEARLRHEVVRLDDPDLVRERLATLAVLCESELVAAYAAHASAAATGDADGLAAVADRFERLGLLLYAAGRAYSARGNPAAPPGSTRRPPRSPPGAKARVPPAWSPVPVPGR